MMSFSFLKVVVVVIAINVVKTDVANLNNPVHRVQSVQEDHKDQRDQEARADHKDQWDQKVQPALQRLLYTM